ncbi:MAG: hypothetical protein C4521_11945 [Actinobacteria bacterium]|nr:MAG: hypothetical protein C4521_11945 [Actinomycetota bacterium]
MRDDMADEFSNYDQCVEIIGCWHSWYSSVDEATFDHFPSVDICGVECTPDFLVSLQGGYQLVGELCRLSNLPEGFRTSVEQAVGYARLSPQTDVMMLIPHDYADQAEKRMLDEGLLHRERDSEPVVVVSFVRDEGSRVTKWIFKRPTQLRGVSFRDEGCLGDKSLHQMMTVTMDGLKVPPKYWRDMKIRYPFCNDTPPALYIACVLWEKVFSAMLTDDDYVRARVDKLAHLPLRATPQSIKDACMAQLDVEVKIGWIRNALDLLQEARLAEKLEGRQDEFEVRFGKILVPGSENRETNELILDRLFGRSRPGESDVSEVQQETLPGV